MSGGPVAALVEVQVTMELTNIDESKALLGRHGFRFSKSMGQNFLTAAWVPAVSYTHLTLPTILLV